MYQAPFRTAGDRVPILRWVQQIPVGNDPAEVDEVVRANQTALPLHQTVPRLLVHGQPGSVVGRPRVAWCRHEGDGLDVVDVGAGTHFLPEDQPDAIAHAIRSWLNTSVSLGT
jgi:haloalkane dehalogenase